MNKTFINSFKVQFSQDANGFIYFLKKLPLLGKKIPDSLYKHTNIKFVIGIIRFILKIISSIFFRVLYFGLMIYLPYYFINKNLNVSKAYFLHTFFFLSFIIGSFMDSSIFNDTKNKDFTMIRLMRADAKQYYINKFLYKQITEILYFLVPMLIVASLTDLVIIEGLILLLELACFRFIGEGFYLFIYTKLNKNLLKNYVYIGIFFIIGLALAYGLPMITGTLNFVFLFNIFSVCLIVLIGGLFFCYIVRYKNYDALSKRILKRDEQINIETSKADITFSEVKLNDKKLNKESLNTKFYDKKGYAYLNSIFFVRFKSILVTPIKIRTAIILIICSIGVVFSIFVPEEGKSLVNFLENKPATFIFIMYILSISEKVCKALFYNCDSKLLRYNFYKKPDVILKNFKMRLTKIVIMNSIPTMVLCFSLLCIVLINGCAYKLINLLPLFICIICLSCFFSIHYLFLYYVIQPYTSELTIKNPVFTIINYVVYFVCYFCINLEISSVYFTLGVALITVIYMIIALILTYKLAPNTFKFQK